MKGIFILLSVLLYSNMISQELTCDDFREGAFYVPISEELPFGWKIIREGKTQIETVTEDPQKLLPPNYPKTQYEIIEWIDECSYRLIYDESKGTLTEEQKAINQNGGALTQMIKIEDNCFYYKSTVFIEDKEMITNGRICKD